MTLIIRERKSKHIEDSKETVINDHYNIDIGQKKACKHDICIL